jgi:HK97 family phage major capsid protein
MTTDYLAHETLRRIKLLADCGVPDRRLTALAQRASLANILLKSAEMQPIRGAEQEYLQARAHIAGKPYDSMQPIIGWDLLTMARADTVYPAGGGGYLVETEVPTAADALRPTMICAALGATFIEARGNVAWPRQTALASAQWLGSETTVATETQQTLSQLALTPHTVAAYTEASRQLLLQSNADAIIARDLLRIIAAAADLAALYGSGTAGQPTGLTLDAGVGSFSGTGAVAATFIDAFVGLGDALDIDAGGVAANRTTAGLLRTRPETTGSTRTVWMGKLTNGAVVDYPARSSTAVASGNAIVGNWKYLVIATWGGGIELVVNPYGDQVTGVNNFRQGVVGFRAMLTMDAGAIYPAAFTVASSVT